MKILIALFLAAFAVFFGLGYMTGTKEAAAPEALMAAAFKPVRLVFKPPSGSQTGVVELVYQLNSKVLYRFDTDTDLLTSTDELAATLLQAGYSDYINFPTDASLIVTLLGGSTAGFALKDLIAESSKTRKKEVIATILGAISGYAAGYKLGLGTPPSPTSPATRKILSDGKAWIEYKKTYILLVVFRAFQAASLVSDEAEKEKLKGVAALSYRMWSGKSQINGVDFLMAASQLNRAATLAKTSITADEALGERTTREQLLEWWWVSALVAGCLVAIVIVVFTEWKAAAKKSDTPAQNGIARPTDAEIQRYGDPRK